ncbi:hypothetical protein Cgig2_005534 [Carnegiea gigantea]|uniref:Uncharacterized protein n=1 Tax=Carnegiea gigantea TaxID=171969 RepID=A0A9Q1GIU8_9CARY|nr:hypothetical protein Cgig2_005534 [Carnegiea gigantea]
MVHSLDDIERRLCNPVWFYVHTTRFHAFEKRTFSQIATWFEVDHGGQYDAFELVTGITEDDIIPVLHLQAEEIDEPIVRDFIDTEDFRYYVEDEEAVLSFEEQLTRIWDTLRKEKEAHKSTRAELELWKARVAALQGYISQGQPADDMPHMGGENVETEAGLTIDNSNSAADKDAEQNFGVRTKGHTVPHLMVPETPYMAAEVRVANEAVSTMPAPGTGEGRDDDVRYTGGVGETALVPEQRTETPAAATVVATPPVN